MVHAGLIMGWYLAVARTGGPPVAWFTVAVPTVAAVQAVATEVVNAAGTPLDAGALVLALFPVAVLVTLVGAFRARRRWKSGLVAWSLVLVHLGVSVGALLGIPLGTFGTVTRTDELLFLGAVPALLAILVAMLLVPVGTVAGRLGVLASLGLGIPVYLLTEAVLVPVLMLAGLGLLVGTLGAAPAARPG